jgi:hypothetical protein
VLKLWLAVLVVLLVLLGTLGSREDDRIGARDTAPAGVRAVELVGTPDHRARECGDRPSARCDRPR